MIEYRKAILEDISELANLRKEMLSENTLYKENFLNIIIEKTKEYLYNDIKNGNCISWLALDNKEIISMCCLSIFNIPPNDWCINGKTGYIGNMFTKIKYRREGIAKYLLSKIIEEAKAINCERLLLNTTDNGKRMYENIGFEFSPTSMVYYPFGLEYKKY